MLRPSARSLLSQLGWQVGPAAFDTVVVAERSFVRGYVAAHSSQSAEQGDGLGDSLGEGLVATAAQEMPRDGAGEEEARRRAEERALLRLAAQAASLTASSEEANGRRPCLHTGIGVAASQEEAARLVALSAVSAHRVLASWFGVGVAENIAVTGSDGTDWRTWTLVWPAMQVDWGAGPQPIYTVGRVLEPVRDDKVLIRGFGGGSTLEEAERACHEAVGDELAFLGQELPLRTAPRFAPGRRFYRERAMHPAGAGAIIDWVKELEEPQAHGSAGTLQVRCTTLGSHLGQNQSPELVVVRAEGTEDSLLPVVHGRGFPPYSGLRNPAAGQRLLEGFHPWF